MTSSTKLNRKLIYMTRYTNGENFMAVGPAVSEIIFSRKNFSELWRPYLMTKSSEKVTVSIPGICLHVVKISFKTIQ